MIDWHSHILPGVDDGSRDIEESVALLNLLSEQGVKRVVATPHFLADKQTVEEFLSRRDQALEELKTQMPDNAPEIVCGAEIKYYSGISRLENLSKLCIEGSRLLLIEMSMTKWTEYTVRELVELASSGKVTVVIAHVERYMGMQSSDVMYRLYESGILMQVNAGFFLGLGTKRRAFSMLKNGEIHLIGSDCHNIASRPPFIGKAFEAISKKMGDDFLCLMREYGYSLFNKQ